MSIETGQYTIVNVRQSNIVYLPDNNDGTPVAANYEQGNTKERVSQSPTTSTLHVKPKFYSGTSTN
jgi:hypothetical protein